jgi:CSLREA domain-containing protein
LTRELPALIILLACSALLASRAQAAGFGVNSLGDTADASPGDGICATAGGVCTLRAALQEANANGAAADTITFTVTGTIALTSGLPNLSAGNTTIAGANQTVAITASGSTLPGSRPTGTASEPGPEWLLAWFG